MFASRLSVFVALLFALLLVASCTGEDQDDLVIYSGRSQSLVEPLIERFEEESGLSVGVRYGDTAQLAVALTEEGESSRADLFWAQDAGALGAVHAAGLLADLPSSLLEEVPPHYRNDDNTWVATSGRARTLVYSASRVDASDLPDSILDLTDEEYQGRVGWAPTNGSFQAHLTAMRRIEGDDGTREWLRAMKENGAQAYSNNTSIVQAVADGEIDYGLANHYYLYRFKSEDPDFPVEQDFFEEGDPGNLINVAGVGVLDSSERQDVALQFVEFLLSEEAQQYVANEVFEYPVVEEVQASSDDFSAAGLEELQPAIDLDELRDLEETLDLLRDEELL